MGRSRLRASIEVCLLLLLASCRAPEPGADEVGSGAVTEGAPCSAGTAVRCQAGPVMDERLGEVCLVGIRRCVDGAFGLCEDVEAVPLEGGEASGGISRSSLIGSAHLCGGCDPDCYVTFDCPSGADEGDSRLGFDGVRFDAEVGGLVIGQPSRKGSSRYAWISSNGMNTINKLNMKTLTNDGVFRVGSDPSRTTLDLRGNVYVGNRKSGNVTKVAGELSECVPGRNGVPGVQTSLGETPPGSKIFNVLGDINDVVGGDECIVWQRPVGAGTGSPKALAIDARGRLWVGDFDTKQYFVMDTKNGATLAGPIDMGDAPYGCAIASDGRLWSGSTSGSIQSIDTTVDTPTVANRGPLIPSDGGVYGIAVDAYDRVVVASGKSVSRYDPATGTWAKGVTLGAKGVTVDTSGHIYVASDSSYVIEHDLESLAELQRWSVIKAPRGCAPDFFGRVWAANHGSADAAVVEVATGVITYINTHGTNYTYSDFTGFGFTAFTMAVGHFTRIYDGVDSCGLVDSPLRSRLHFEAETPGPTSISFWARSSDTLAGLETALDVYLGEVPPAATSVPVTSELDAAGQDGRARFLQIRVTLSRNGSPDSPVLHTLALEEYCE